MKVARAGLIAAAILTVVTEAWAQKPDFSGTWTLDRASSPAARDAEGDAPTALGSGPATVKQTEDTLTIQRSIGADTVTLTFQLDGTGSRNVLAGPDGRTVDTLSTVRWDGPRLTIVTKQEIDGKLAEATQVWTVAGNTLTVETRDARGTQKRIYKR